jgi:hypothetical protein
LRGRGLSRNYTVAWRFTMIGRLDLLSVVGLALGAIFGLAGTVVAQPHLQQIFWAIDSAGLVMATCLLSLKFFRKGNDLVAAGFLVFAIGEGVLLSGTAAGADGSVPAFAAGTALWGTALLLVSIPREFAIPVRAIGVVAAMLFMITSARIFLGEQLLPTTSPLPFFAYPFLVLTFLGWIWSLLRETA